jgi:hypothetical protein
MISAEDYRNLEQQARTHANRVEGLLQEIQRVASSLEHGNWKACSITLNGAEHRARNASTDACKHIPIKQLTDALQAYKQAKQTAIDFFNQLSESDRRKFDLPAISL